MNKSESKLKFFHVHGFNGKGGATIAYETVKHEHGKLVKLAIGFCSHKDNFCKKLGRDAALKQWVAGNTINLITKRKQKELPATVGFLARSAVYLFDQRIDI